MTVLKILCTRINLKLKVTIHNGHCNTNYGKKIRKAQKEIGFNVQSSSFNIIPENALDDIIDIHPNFFKNELKGQPKHYQLKLTGR